MPTLFVYQGHDQGSLFDVEEGTQAIGRDAVNQIQVHDAEVSSQHAEIRFHGTHCLVADLESANGVYINGRRIEQPQILTSGDRLKLGNTLMLYTDPGEMPDDPIETRLHPRWN